MDSLANLVRLPGPEKPGRLHYGISDIFLLTLSVAVLIIRTNELICCPT
jgi:hypothetical protein